MGNARDGGPWRYLKARQGKLSARFPVLDAERRAAGLFGPDAPSPDGQNAYPLTEWESVMPQIVVVVTCCLFMASSARAARRAKAAAKRQQTR